MKPTTLNRRVHYWLTVFVALPLLVMSATGVLLQLKKHAAWVQPPEAAGTPVGAGPAGGLAPASFGQLLASLRAVPEARVREWADVDRLDVRPAKGIVKAQTRGGVEVQLDLADGRVLHVAPRRSDVIEALHDGSFFGAWAKYGLFLPAGVLLAVLVGTGVVLFAHPLLRKRRRRLTPHAAPHGRARG